MHLRHVIALPLIIAFGCRERPAESHVESRIIELSCGQSGSQHVGPIDVRLPPFHTLVGVVDLTQPGYEELLDWIRLRALADVHFNCASGTLTTTYTDESATGDGLTCNGNYEATVTATCACDDPVEQCTNEIDDDNDGRVDCEDPDCTWMSHCAPPPWRCTGNDACDADGRVLDAADPYCASPEKLAVCQLDAWCCTYEWDVTCSLRAEALGYCEEDGPDAGPTEPDAGTPDAGVTPDAWTPTPDAWTPTPDAWTPTPDAWVPTPDAWTPPVDAWTPPLSDAAGEAGPVHTIGVLR